MNREQLKEMGLNDEQVESVMGEYGKSVNKTKQDLANAQAENETYEASLAERDTQLEQLGQKAEGYDELKTEIQTMKDTNETEKTELKNQLEKTKLFYEVDQDLIINQARDPKVVRPLLDLETVKFGEDGKLMGLSEQLENLKTSHDYLFVQGETGETPPGTNDHKPGQPAKINPKKDVDPAEAGRLKAAERHAPKDLDNNKGAE